MSYIDLERGELMTELEAAGKRFTALLRDLNTDDVSKPCEGLIWNVGDVAVHVLTVVNRSLDDRRRSDKPDDLAELNALTIEEISERDLHVIADMIDTKMNIILHKVYPKVDDDRRFPFHSGAMIGARAALAITMGEFTLHGWDIAQACGKEWIINPHVAALAWRGILDPLDAWLKPNAATGLSETYVFRLKGEKGTLALEFADNTIYLRPDFEGNADYVIDIEPVELVFVFPYGRRSTNNPALARLVERFESI
jgi:uncharacterized protein (TIGR03083 family)